MPKISPNEYKALWALWLLFVISVIICIGINNSAPMIAFALVCYFVILHRRGKLLRLKNWLEFTFYQQYNETCGSKGKRNICPTTPIQKHTDKSEQKPNTKSCETPIIKTHYTPPKDRL